MAEAALDALSVIFGCPCRFGLVPEVLLFLLGGAVFGILLGAIPGLGGLVGLSLLLPFSFDMEPMAAIAFAIGLIGTVNTSDTLPAVLFAVPGTSAAQATIMDGYPMARRGEAGRALGAAYSASALGGLFGALVLAASIPLLRPLVLLFTSPELFMVTMLGLSMVAVLSGRFPLRGLIVAGVGLALGMVGSDPQIGHYRYAIGNPYLFDGLSLVPIALGIFAIPEMIDLAIQRKASRAGSSGTLRRGVFRGMRDTLGQWFLVVRCSSIGAWVGAMPGLGGAVVDWIAYGHAAQTVRGARSTFGTGDVRGVIAPECANNAREGGALVPTIAFGIPGTGTAALLIVILLIHGIQPGQSMLTTQLSTSYVLIFGLALANVVAVAIMLALSRSVARLVALPARPMAAVVVGAVSVAALSATQHILDLVVLLVLGVAGWIMKRSGWARPPLVLGFILSPIAEQYLFLSVQRYGAEWLTRPLVLLIGSLIVMSLIWGYKSSRSMVGGPPSVAQEPGYNQGEESPVAGDGDGDRKQRNSADRLRRAWRAASRRRSSGGR